jgi:hypothetical protein
MIYSNDENYGSQMNGWLDGLDGPMARWPDDPMARFFRSWLIHPQQT